MSTFQQAPGMSKEAVKSCGCPDTGRGRISRRSFLKGAAATGALAGLVGQDLFTRMAFAATPYDGDVLVVLSLRGGMDGLNAVVPAADPNYVAWRPNVRVPMSKLIQLDGVFGMHPAMAPLKPLWDAGNFGVVHAVGQDKPNRSHFQAMEEMERASPGTSTRTGWLDRVLGLRESGSVFQGMQVGTSLAASAFRGPSGELAMSSIEDFGLHAAWDPEEHAKWQTVLSGLHSGAPDILSDPATAALGALDAMKRFENDAPPVVAAAYPDTDLGRALRDVVRLVKADVGLQVAAVDYGDWDFHEGMGTVDEGLMRDHLDELSKSLLAFAVDLGPLLGKVTLVTLTEFGRRVEENGSGGTDHGYGQMVMMLGGGVNGGRVHGTWPGLGEDDLVDGDLAATSDYRAILAEILERRCGVTQTSSVFPGLPSQRLGVVAPRR